MAKVGDIIEHPVTGEKIIFRRTAKDTGGELLQAELTVKPHGFVAAEHIHPLQEERFEVMSGSIRLRQNGVEKDVRSGEIVTVPRGVSHSWWNSADQEARVLVEVRPALRMEEFFETFFGLAQDGKVDKKTGLPPLVMLALIMREFRKEIYLAQPPIAVQRVVFVILGLVGRLRGYQGRYAYPR
ncbi:MAG: cupin domain-containing protein [Anaerolineae bacterium]